MRLAKPPRCWRGRVIDGAQQLVDLVEASSVVVLPTRVLAVVSDESDNRVLEAAVEGSR